MIYGVKVIHTRSVGEDGRRFYEELILRVEANSFDEAYEKGWISRIFTTNLIYQTPELLKKDWYYSVDMSKYVALIIDTLNHDKSVSPFLNPISKINDYIDAYNLK